MAKTIKKILLIFSILLIILIGGLAYILSDKPTMITPFTYQVSEHVNLGLKQAESADVLIVGDRMGLYLNNFLNPLVENLNKDLKKELKIYNWSREKEGLHRTFYKLKKLKKLPPVIIYQGGSYEWFDKKYDETEKRKILFNFRQFENEKIISSIITFPFLSKLFYKKVKMYPILNLDPKQKVNQSTNFDAKELDFLYYKYELNEMVDYIKQNKSNIILITSPLNLLIPPRETCSESTTNTIVEVQQEIEDQIKNGDYKNAYNSAKLLEKESVANAKTHYLLGITAKYNNEILAARDALLKATLFDCYNWHGNSVYNSIILQTAIDYQTQVIDFEKETSFTNLQDEQVYIDEIFPQNIYYNNLINELTIIVKKYLNITI
jgi:hypothetical protein